MLTVDEYKTLKALARKAGLSTRTIRRPTRISIIRPDIRRLSTMLMEHDRVIVHRRGHHLSFLSWNGYHAVLNNVAKARMAKSKGGASHA